MMFDVFLSDPFPWFFLAGPLKLAFENQVAYDSAPACNQATAGQRISHELEE